MSVSRETPFPHLNPVLDRLLRSTPGRAFVQNLSRNEPVTLEGLTEVAAVLALAAVYRQRYRAFVIICPEYQSAEAFYHHALSTLHKSVYWIPILQSTFTDVSGFALEAERYTTESYHALKRKSGGLFITDEKALQQPVPDPLAATSRGIEIHSGQECVVGDLAKTLVSWGFEQVDRTEQPKTFSIRGGIIDIFLLHARRPVRLEFFGNTVESIRWFNPISQLSVQRIKNVELLPPADALTLTSQRTYRELLANRGAHFVYVHKNHKHIELSTGNGVRISCRTNPWIATPDGENLNLTDFWPKLRAASVKKVYIFTGTTELKRKEFATWPFKVTTIPSRIPQGFYSADLSLACLDLSEVKPVPKYSISRWVNVDPYGDQPFAFHLKDINWGDYVVHRDYGIGIYRGLQLIKTKTGHQECLKIEYADGGFIYVHPDHFAKVHRYISSKKGPVTLSRLGTKRWQQQIQRSRQSAQRIVNELVAYYASKNKPRGFRYTADMELCRLLEKSFPYQETPDQQQAIKEIYTDMLSERPMDRILIGDVGFGKTEVALRAAMKAIATGKTVFFLTPTTILADQHYITCKGRLGPLGVRVALLSRFTPGDEVKQILRALTTGDVDIVVGTHRLLSPDVQTPSLGLLIIDEEHRFGVKHKQRLQEIKSTVDVLTLTATPIPRTLQQALVGIRAVSQLQTPPRERLPIRTSVHYFDWKKIYYPIQFELQRNGQVYFLHNDINALSFHCEKLMDLFPHHTVAIAHGKMPSRKLEDTILAFFAGEIDILLCTVIVESGLDVSNANTIIINNAHKFGLSQLYQIRGRVGRSNRQAFCYLLIPKGLKLTDPAYQRLKTIERLSSLGVGYEIALKDLEIRGPGNLFGYEQSGHIASIGFEMYCNLLSESVLEQQGKAPISPPAKPTIKLTDDAYLPPQYISLVEDRLYFYQRLNTATSNEDINLIEQELKDRFGPPPSEVVNLLSLTLFQTKLTNTPVRTMEITPKGLTCQLDKGLVSEPQAKEVRTALQSWGEVQERKKTTVKYTQVLVNTKDMNNSWGAAEAIVSLFSHP
jgi:transcription-repair coupling factor (superfamily II helicase)